MKKKLNTKTDLPSITSHLPHLIMNQLSTASNHQSDSSQTLNSPIYSSNFRNKQTNNNTKLEITNDDLVSTANDEYLKDTSTLINFEISSNYLYLVNTDLCNNDDDTLAN